MKGSYNNPQSLARPPHLLTLPLRHPAPSKNTHMCMAIAKEAKPSPPPSHIPFASTNTCTQDTVPHRTPHTRTHITYIHTLVSVLHMCVSPCMCVCVFRVNIGSPWLRDAHDADKIQILGPRYCPLEVYLHNCTYAKPDSTRSKAATSQRQQRQQQRCEGGLTVAHGSPKRKHEYLPFWALRRVNVSKVHSKKAKG